MCGSAAISSFGNRVHDRLVKLGCFWSNKIHTKQKTGQEWPCLLVAASRVSRSSPQHVCAATVSITTQHNTMKWVIQLHVYHSNSKNLFTLVDGSCGSRGWAGCPLIRQFKPRLLLSTGHDGQVSNLHGCSATISVRTGSEVSSDSRAATLL